MTVLGLLLEEKLLSPESVVKARGLWFTSIIVIFFFPARAPVLVLFCCVICCCSFLCCWDNMSCQNQLQGGRAVAAKLSFFRKRIWDPNREMPPIVGRWLINVITIIPFRPAQRPVSQATARSVTLTATIPVPFVLTSSQNPWSSRDFILCSREVPQDTGPSQFATVFPGPRDWLEGASNGDQLSGSRCDEAQPHHHILNP